MESNSKQVARAALQMAMTASREEENALKEKLRAEGIRAAAVDYGGDALSAVKTIIERGVVAAKREFLIRDTHSEEGAVAGATHEAFLQVLPKALGLSIGGKIGLARRGEHVSVAVFCGIGLLHLDEVAGGMGHRAIA
ncbi:MAG: hut operon positive regulator HutP [Clostridia bacterium]|nr:hut operon positive regulator HutP [Clostridia bacterium]